MDVRGLLDDFQIPYITEGNKHCTEGWLNVHCPFCPGSQDYHLGVSLDGGAFHCWRCGGRNRLQALSKLLGVSGDRAHELIRQYGGTSRVPSQSHNIKIRRKSHRLPSDVGPLSSPHLKYLLVRGFDPLETGERWGLLGTGPCSLLDGIRYRHRILAPILWGGERVSFQARDITGKARLKYMACPKARELVHHKHILYGKQEAWKETGICVEGITDVWRLGEDSFAVFGIEYTLRQVREISRHFKRVAVAFDEEPQAQEQARKLCGDLRLLGVHSFLVPIEGDPGGMKQDDADHLVREIMGGR